MARDSDFEQATAAIRTLERSVIATSDRLEIQTLILWLMIRVKRAELDAERAKRKS